MSRHPRKEQPGNWARTCSACGSDDVSIRGGLVVCNKCRTAEAEDPWTTCPNCGGVLTQRRVITVGSIRTGERRCYSCGFRATIEARIVHVQYRDGDRVPGAHKHMRDILKKPKD